MPKAFSDSLADLKLFFYVSYFSKRVQQAEPPLFPFANILKICVESMLWRHCSF